MSTSKQCWHLMGRVAAFLLFILLFWSSSIVFAADPDWTVYYGSDLQTARMGHLSDVLPDGRLVVFGGHGTDFIALDSAEVWTPTSDSFSLLNMQHSHDGAALARFPDGRYLIAGGADDWGIAPGFAAAELYNPTTNTFSLTGSMVRPRMNATAVTLTGGKVLVVGGWYDTSSATYGELYNPSSGTFSATGALLTPRALPLLLPTADGKAVVFGGVGPYGSPRIQEVELYDPASNSFSLLQTTLLDGENDWHIATSNYTQPQKLADGRYLLLASRELEGGSGTSEYTLLTFDPASKDFARQVTSPSLPTSDLVSLWPPLVDQASGVAYLTATSLNNSDQTISLLVVDLTDWTWETPETSYRLADGYYLGGMSGALMPDGSLFLTGGHSELGSETHFSAINRTLQGYVELGVEPCTYTLSPQQQSFAGEGGSGTLTVTTSLGSCAWTAASSAGWLAITSGGSGTGSGTISYTVQANPLGEARSATLSVAGQIFTVFQAGPVSGETLDGSGGDDVLTVTAGNLTVNGLGGSDTVELPFFPNVYSFVQTGTGQYTASYLGYTLVLNSVEYVRFGSVWQDKTELPIAAMVSGTVQAQLVKLTDVYLAYFGRAPDVIGLEYWQQQYLTGEQTFDEIIINFAYSAEAKALFPQDGSNKAFVAAVYQNCFNRSPDLAGWYYWTYILNGGDPEAVNWSTFDWAALEESDIDALGGGNTSLTERGKFIAQVLLGAYAETSGPEDRGLLTNRHEVALDYVNRLSAAPEEGFDAAINDLLGLVDMTASTLQSAGQVLDYVFTTTWTLSEIMADPDLLAQLWALDVYIDWAASATTVPGKVILPANAPLSMNEVEVSVVFNSYVPDANGDVALKVPEKGITDAYVMLEDGSGEYVVYQFATVLPGETSVEFSVEATAINLVLNGIERAYLIGDLTPAEVRSIIRDNSSSFITAFTAAQGADPYCLRSDNLANVYNSIYSAAVTASQSALQQAIQALSAQSESQTLARGLLSDTDAEGLTVLPIEEQQDFQILPARSGLTGYGNMTGDLLIQNDSMLPARYKTVNLFTGQTMHDPQTGVFGDIVSPQSSLIYGFNAGTAKVGNNHFERVALTLYTAGWAFYWNDDAAIQAYVKNMNRSLNERLLVNNIVKVLSSLVPVSDESFYMAWIQWIGKQGWFQKAMDKLYVEKDLTGAVKGFVNGLLNWGNLKSTLLFVAKYYGEEAGVDLLKEKAKWLFKITTLEAKIWIYAGDLAATEADLFTTSPVLEFTEIYFPLYLKNYGPSGMSKVSTLGETRRVTLYGAGLGSFSSGGSSYEPTVVLEAMDTEDKKRTHYVEGTDIHIVGSDSLWFDLPYDWVNTGSEIVGPIWFQLRHAFVDTYLSDAVISGVRFPYELTDATRPYYKIDLLSDLEITGVSKDKVTRGETLTIFGSGFAPLMADNHVLFTTNNGNLVYGANVTYASSSSLEVIMPDGLSFGPMGVQVFLGSLESNVYDQLALIPKPVEALPEGRTDFEDELMVALDQVEDVDIFYSIDSGSEQKYSGPIMLNNTATIHAQAKVTVGGTDYSSGFTSFSYYKCAENETLVDGECVDPNATEPITFNAINSYTSVHFPSVYDPEQATIIFSANVNGQLQSTLDLNVEVKNDNYHEMITTVLISPIWAYETEKISVSGSINMNLSKFTATGTADYLKTVTTYSNPRLVRYDNSGKVVETYPNMNFSWEDEASAFWFKYNTIRVIYDVEVLSYKRPNRDINEDFVLDSTDNYESSRMSLKFWGYE